MNAALRLVAKLAAAASLALPALFVIVPATPAAADPQPEPVALINRYDGHCLDAGLGNMTANGTRLQLWNCWNDPGNDQWRD